jgi:hypothetical protein
LIFKGFIPIKPSCHKEKSDLIRIRSFNANGGFSFEGELH